MRRILAILLTLLILLPVCAAEEKSVDSREFQLPERTRVELALFVLMADTIDLSINNVLTGSVYEADFEVHSAYNTSKDAIMVVVDMPRWDIYEILNKTDMLRTILDSMAVSAVMIVQDMNDGLYEPLDVYTVGFAGGTTKYLNVNGRDLSSLAGLM